MTLQLSDPTPAQARRRVPAEPEFWIFVFGDLAVFTAFFFVWSAAERAEPEVFEQGRATLSQTIGAANTLVLLASSAAVARAVHALCRHDQAGARRAYAFAALSGMTFLVLKAVEYGGHLRHGLAALDSAFHVDYFAFTGIHALHVLLGITLLLLARSRAGSPTLLFHEAAATYWHVIDIVWIVLFTLIYLG